MKYSRKNIFSRINKSIHIEKKYMFYSALLTFLMTGISLISPFLYKILVDDVMKSGNLKWLYWLIPSMAAVYLIQTVFSGIKTYCGKKFSNITLLETKNALMSKVLSQDISETEKANIGRQSGNVDKDSAAVYLFVSGHIVNFICSMVIAVIYFVLMLFIDPWLSILSVVLIPLTMCFSYVIGQKYNKIQQNLFDIRAGVRTYLFTTIRQWREIKVNTLEDDMVRKYDEMLESEKAENIVWIRYFALNDVFYEIKNRFVLQVMMYFVGGIFIIKGSITIGSLLMFMSYMESMSSSVDSVMKSNADFKGQKAVFDRLFETLERPVCEKGCDIPEEPVVSISNVDFTYTTPDKKVLKNVNCGFEYRKKYLLVGKSGEGKSTLIKLLLGINKSTSGEIKISGLPIENIDLRSLNKNIGVVMQENMFFNLSIHENLELIAPSATESEIWAALSLARIDDFISSLPNGLDTVIGERGIKLSGGQKQRLAIARVILHDPKIVILDEAMSAVDAVTENEILENFEEIFAGKTLIMISHKPVPSINFDKLYSISKGEVFTLSK